MGPDHTDQLRPLRDVFAEVCGNIRPARLALLGCATGNGLEHVDPALTKSAVAIDIHPEFVAVTKERYDKALGAALEVRCDDLTSCVLPSGAFDLVHVALVFEHVDARALVPRIANWVAAGRSLCGRLAGRKLRRRRNFAHHPLSVWQYRRAKGHHAPVCPRRRSRLCSSARACVRRHWTVPLSGGKRFDVCEYGRSA
jgi:hypothetical protein